MSMTEILAELPKLSVQDRREILSELWNLEELEGPSPCEQSLLDEIQSAYDANPYAGAPWTEVEVRLRRRA